MHGVTVTCERCPLQNADKHVNKILIGNKCDMEASRVVSKAEGDALARRYKMPFFETSAKKDIGVTEVSRRCCAEGTAAALMGLLLC